MPTSTRRQARSREQRLSEASGGALLSDDLPAHGILEDPGNDQSDGGEGVEDQGMEDDDEDSDDEGMDGMPPVPLTEHALNTNPRYNDSDEDQLDDDNVPPPGLKEISSLASWTVSTAKPGNGVAALRSPDLNHFWQSDGPQPHLLSMHFFKLVSIAHMRVFLDFESDESYTPTKIQFLAGMGAHDVQEFAEMSFEQPTGWIDVDFSNIGPIEYDEDEENRHHANDVDWSRRPVLRAFVVQVRILENHQNGKDTHLRAVQVFARDETQGVQRHNNVLGARSANALPMRAAAKGGALQRKETNNIKLADWMLEPDLR
jgi:anaphase-promoting complex subunit 10